MKRTLIVTALLAAFGHAPGSFATNWFELQNTEAPEAPDYRFWGFIQPQFVHNTGGPANGITGAAQARAYNGKTPVFNLVGPDLTSGDQAQIFRARPGLRGKMPGTEGNIDYFLLAELGNNALTVNGSDSKRYAVLTDATVTFNYIPGARVRVGLGRLPIGEEAMLGEPTLDYLAFTSVTDGLLNERFVTPYKASPLAPATGIAMNGGAGGAAIAGSVGAFRDIGVEVFDWFNHEKWEYAYGLMLSQADGVNFNTANNPGNHDVSGRLQASYVFGGSGPRRKDITAFIWHQDGNRYFNGANYDRMREGLGFKYVNDKFRVGSEYIKGSGMIYMGLNPAFNPVPGGFVPVQLMAVESYNNAKGYYLDTGWKLTEKFEAELRFDTYDRMPNSAPDERRTNTWTLGGQYFYSNAFRFMVNYSRRSASVVNPGTAVGTPASTALLNAMNVLDATGNLWGVQMTYRY